LWSLLFGASGLRLFQLQLKLFDLALCLLRLAFELHPLQLGDHQLQVFDLVVTGCSSFESNCCCRKRISAFNEPKGNILGMVVAVARHDVECDAWLIVQAGFASQYPVFVVAPLGGAIADRHNRYYIVIATQTASMILAAMLTWLTLTNRLHVCTIFVMGSAPTRALIQEQVSCFLQVQKMVIMSGTVNIPLRAGKPAATA
jgi:hypothetical protein